MRERGDLVCCVFLRLISGPVQRVFFFSLHICVCAFVDKSNTSSINIIISINSEGDHRRKTLLLLFELLWCAASVAVIGNESALSCGLEGKSLVADEAMIVKSTQALCSWLDVSLLV